jgi:hypothetical protein
MRYSKRRKLKSNKTKRMCKFKKQYGGKLSTNQIRYINTQIDELKLNPDLLVYTFLNEDEKAAFFDTIKDKIITRLDFLPTPTDRVLSSIFNGIDFNNVNGYYNDEQTQDMIYNNLEKIEKTLTKSTHEEP